MMAAKTGRRSITAFPTMQSSTQSARTRFEKGFLFAGTENAVFFSIDDGDHWNSLRLNMPATAIRDLVVHDDDLVVGTHGRSFWILDDITPLRQLTATDDGTHLFKPELATRVHWNNNTDTPLPPEEPAGKNPPDGAVIDYYLGSDNHGPVKLEILDGQGRLVRRYDSEDKLVQVREQDLQVPMYWIRPLQALDVGEGFHRFVWDLHYTPLGGRSNFPISAIFHDTAPGASSPWVAPGTYEVRLITGGKTYSQHLMIRLDPRIKTSASDMAEQFRVAYGAYVSVNRLRDAIGVISEFEASTVGWASKRIQSRCRRHCGGVCKDPTQARPSASWAECGDGACRGSGCSADFSGPRGV